VRAALLAGCSLAVMLAGCSLARRIPEMRYFALAVPTERAPAIAAPVHVGIVTADQAYASARMAHRTSPYELEYEAFERWAAPPRALVQAALRDTLEQEGVGPLVEVTGEVRRFESVDADPDHVHVALVLALRATRGGAVLVDRTYAEQEPASSDEPEAMAASLSRALGRVLARFRGDVAAAVR
jgi:ABC-type uncharacterized transport system auxiliary subunit